jgi:hypothetical protein
MSRRDENKLNMFKTVRDWLKGNATVLGEFARFTETLAAFVAMLVVIGSLAKKKTGKTIGITSEKANARQLLEDLTMDMIVILKAYAIFTDKVALLNDVDFTETQIDRSSEQLLISRAGKIKDHAEAEQAGAEEFGMTAELITEFEAGLGDFTGRQTSSRMAIVSRKSTGEEMEIRMDEADDLLKSKLDSLMELAKRKHPELYNQYEGARIIIDR